VKKNDGEGGKQSDGKPSDGKQSGGKLSGGKISGGKAAGGKAGGAKSSGGTPMKNFEERLARLELLGEEIRKSDLPLDSALKAFEEGIKLARTLEKDLEKIESRIEILMNEPDAGAMEVPELDLFNNGE
jgi:exodeoxyribonuclease VII small subunit